jgi:hypothetical protein
MTDSLYPLIDGVDIPDWLFEAALCEPNKGQIESVEIHDWVDAVLLPLAKQHFLARKGLRVSTNHVHIGTAGLSPHDHNPHELTSVLYLTDSEGCLVLHLNEAGISIDPRAGRFIVFAAGVTHHVMESPADELRISLVTNYDYPPV